MKKKILVIFVVVAMLFLAFATTVYGNTEGNNVQDEEIIEQEDEILELPDEVLNHLTKYGHWDKNDDGKVSKSEAQEIYTIEIEGTEEKILELENIDFLKDMPNLQTIDIENAKIEDISYLYNLENIEYFIIDNLETEQLDFSELKNKSNLKTLILKDIKVDSLASLKECNSLWSLELNNVFIRRK